MDKRASSKKFLSMSKRFSSNIWLQLGIICLITNIIALVVLAVWRLFSPTSLLFDQFVLLTLGIWIGAIWLLRSKIFDALQRRDRFTKVLAASFCALFFFSTFEYAILAVDRSRSLYVFQWINDGKVKYDGRLVISGVESVESRDPVAIYQRIIEHEKRKLMTIDKSTKNVKLTAFGKFFLSCANSLSELFSLNGWRTNSK